MYTRKNTCENVDPLSRGILRAKKAPGTNGLQLQILKTKVEGPLKAGPAKVGVVKQKRLGICQTRRAAFGDITNATTKDKHVDGKGIPIPVKTVGKTLSTTNRTSKICRPTVTKKATELKKPPLKEVTLSSKSRSSGGLTALKEASAEPLSQAEKNIAAGIPVDREEEDFSFIIVEEDALLDAEKSEKSHTPLLSVDEENYTDVFNVGIYAQDIFEYYKRRERMFEMPQYLNVAGCRVTANMRAILVDWLVEIQENFELNHETLYLAVKLCDMYFSRVAIEKEVLQLVGAAAVFIAAKFDERCPPLIDDFTYVCDNAFTRQELIDMEMDILKTIDFDLGIPISYRFLRRYSKVAHLSLVTLTLARYILELSLMEHEFIVERDSKLAAASLYIAMKMKGEGTWDGDVVKSSGYNFARIKRLVFMLNTMLGATPSPQISTIRGKYSHIVFHEVAKITPILTEELL